MLLKVGELARRTGLTIRTLHHYHEIGLLAPSGRSDAGYRLYSRADIARLHGIQALKQLGLPLTDIGAMLASDGASLPDLIARQLTALDRQVEQAKALRARLLRLQKHLKRGDDPDLVDWLTTLESMTMYDKYFTPAETRTLKQHRKAADVETHWPMLVKSVRTLMAQGVAPAHPQARSAVREWSAMLDKMVGGDAGLMIKLDAMTRNEPTVQARNGVDPAVLDYVMAARAAEQTEVYAKYLDPDEVSRIAANRARNAAKWPPLILAMRARMEQGASPEDDEVRALARQWQALFEASFTGGDAALQAKLRKVFEQEPELLRSNALDPALLDFVRSACAA